MTSQQGEDQINKDSKNEESLTHQMDDVIGSLVNAGTTPYPQNDDEYTYEEYEIEEYEEEEILEPCSTTEVRKHKTKTRKVSKNSKKNEVFMTENTSFEQTSNQNRPKTIPNPNRSSTKVPPLARTPSNEPDPDEVEEMLDGLLKNGTLPSSESREPVLNLINRKKVSALFSADYESAEVYENAAISIIENEVQSAKDHKDHHQEELRNYRNNSLQQKMDDTEKKYKDQIKKNSEECERRLKEAETRHNEEIEQFKENWKNPEYIKQFSKPSSLMLNMRYIEKKLALAKRYGDAINQRKLGDQQQQIEQENLRKTLEIQMKTDYLKMRERHKNEIEKIEGHYDGLNQGLKDRMNREIKSIKFAMTQNNLVKQPDQMRQKWKMAGTLKTAQTSLPTPRTKKKFDQYKYERSATLVVTPFDDSTLSKLPTSSFRSPKHQVRGSQPSRSASALSTGRSALRSSSRSSISTPKTSPKKKNSQFPNLS